MAPRIYIPTHGCPARRIIPAARAGVAVEYVTELCDFKGRTERVLSRGRNMVHDTAMDALATSMVSNLVSRCSLYDAQFTLKRVGQGGNYVVASVTGPDNIEVSSNQGFFDANDVGRSFKIAGWPELLVTAFNGTTSIQATARGSLWLPGFTPDANQHTDFGIHYTSMTNPSTEFTTITTFDTNSANYNAELTDYANERFQNQRIWLSDVNTGSNWTIKALAWRSSGGTLFGLANTPTTDVVPTGKRYRVTFIAYMAYAPLDLAAVTIDWGTTIGSYDFDIITQQIKRDGAQPTILHPKAYASGSLQAYDTYTPTGPWFEGDPSFADPTGITGMQNVTVTPTTGSYTAGTHNRTKTYRIADTQTIVNKQGLCIGPPDSGLVLALPGSTFNKPLYYWCELTFRNYWTRELTN